MFDAGVDAESVWAMDDMGSRMRANMEKVLRAMDVIPPFDNDPASPPRAKAVPTLDLGEKILAEQRRMTARKRRAPGSVENEQEAGEGKADAVAIRQDVASDGELAVPVDRCDRASDEAADLHQIVADIVARDIDRLCEGLKRNACCPA